MKIQGNDYRADIKADEGIVQSVCAIFGCNTRDCRLSELQRPNPTQVFPHDHHNCFFLLHSSNIARGGLPLIQRYVLHYNCYTK